jgi:predicted homoserine dehydrogenase-like protein
VCRPRAEGGQLTRKGTVEVVSSLERDGRPVSQDLRWGVYVTIEAPDGYVQDCFAQYGLPTDSSGRYAALYRPYHLVGLELTVSVLRAGLRGEATGYPTGWRGDVVAVAKRDLAVGEVVDGEGGYCVYGRLLPAAQAMKMDALPIGLAHNVKLKSEIAAGQVVRWADVSYEANDPTVRFRREMERAFTP